jgi:hypothetical protein
MIFEIKVSFITDLLIKFIQLKPLIIPQNYKWNQLEFFYKVFNFFPFINKIVQILKIYNFINKMKKIDIKFFSIDGIP